MNIINVIVLSETILAYFENEIEGYASEYAWYELVQETEKYVYKNNEEEFLNFLEFGFGILKKDFKKILKDYKKQIKELERFELI